MLLQEIYVSFETAKLLKEKGFAGENAMWYTPDGYISEEGINDGIDPTADEIFKDLYPAPTQDMALRWLREVHGIFNQPQHFWKANKYECYPYSIKNGKHLHDFHLGYHDTYEEACETAIKYCLTKVI